MRSTDRFSLADVRCEVANASLEVTDLSVGGFYVACDPPLPLGQTLAFVLAFPDGGRFPALGRVVWVNPAGGGRARAAGCGVAITRIAFPDKLAIIDRLRRAGVAPVERAQAAGARRA